MDIFKQFRWIFAILGWLLTRNIFGALMGFFTGLVVEGMQKKDPRFQSVNQPRKAGYSPANFEVNLLSLCAVVIKSGGDVSRSSLDYVRTKFVSLYGKERANQAFRIFNEQVKKQEIPVERICVFVRAQAPYEVRLQIVHFLFEVAHTDGYVNPQELYQIRRIAMNLMISQQNYQSIESMFLHSDDEAYKILGISKNATDSEVKKAYRAMAKKYHPDRVASENEAIRKGAEEKFKKVQQAYEKIQKQRGF